MFEWKKQNQNDFETAERLDIRFINNSNSNNINSLIMHALGRSRSKVSWENGAPCGFSKLHYKLV